jgi:hypothetical protein
VTPEKNLIEVALPVEAPAETIGEFVPGGFKRPR